MASICLRVNLSAGHLRLLQRTSNKTGAQNESRRGSYFLLHQWNDLIESGVLSLFLPDGSQTLTPAGVQQTASKQSGADVQYKSP